MRQSRLHSARHVAKALGGCETAIDQSILDSLTLMRSIINYRLETGAAAEVGHEALMTARGLLVSLGDARDQAIACHRQLAATRDDQNLRAEDVGCTWNKGSSGLSVVAEAA